MSVAEPTKKKSLGTLVRWAGTLLSTALFIWLIVRQDWRTVLEKSTAITLWALALALALYFLGQMINTLRWHILLRAQQVEVSYWQAMKLAWAGVFASNFLPSTIGGDGFRMVGVYPYTRRKTIAIGSVALDRVVNMSAMLCLLPVPFLVFGTTLGRLLSVTIVLPDWLQRRFDRYFPKITGAFRTWAAHPSAFLWAFLVAWPSNLVPMAATYLIARQLGMHITYWQVVGVQTVTYFLSVLPISVNGYGLREVTYTTLYASLGASLEQASALALVTRLLTVVVTIPGALWLGKAVGDVAENEPDGA